MVFVKTAERTGAFALAHISDFHICDPAGSRLRDFASKRLLSYLSWRLRRRAAHRPEVLATLVRALQSTHADQIAVTGDLTHLALPAEFDAARRRLETLGAPERVFVVPGNHDALVANARGAPFARWTGYTRSDDDARAGDLPLPALRRRGPVALIGVSSACPSPPFHATGRIGAGQMRRLGEILQTAAAERLFRVVLLHHPPAPGVVAGRKRLTDMADLGFVLARHGAELVLHGHSHRRQQAALKGPGGRSIPVLGVSSASCAGPHPARRAAFRLFRIGGGPDGWHATRQDHVYAPETGEFAAEPPSPM